jgi:tetratricopeptide (TPR) repeat protein
VEAAPESRHPSIGQARAWLGQNRPEYALLAARAVTGTVDEEQGAWAMLEADALRALGRHAEAAFAYDRASRLLPNRDRAQAGYLAALLYHRRLNQSDRALAMLDSAGVDVDGSPLRERGLLLRARALKRLGRSPYSAARCYLADYPNSAAAAEMRGYLESAD